MVTPGRLNEIRSLDDVLSFLDEELAWPTADLTLGEAAFDYEPAELGIDPDRAPSLASIRELRPLDVNQVWGVFLLEFEGPKLRVTELRQILNRLVTRKRASGRHRTWDLKDLLFVVTTNSSESIELHLLAFVDKEGNLPTLRSLPWRPGHSPPQHLTRLENELLPHLTWPDDPSDADAWRDEWRQAFVLEHGEAITTSSRLASRMADVARHLRDLFLDALATEDGSGPFTTLMGDVRAELVADVEVDDFADMCAQTLVYGVLTARVMDPETFGASPLLSSVPLANPFLSAFFEEVHDQALVLDLDSTGLEGLVADLRSSKIETVLDQFEEAGGHVDPVIHFYEEFLKEYDRSKRMEAGAFYTPHQVVGFMTRAVDEILKTRFGLADGVADASTWAEVAERNDFEVPDGVDPDSMFVSMIDPATGTGTFLIEWIRRAEQSFRANHPDEDWSSHLEKHVLPSMHAFELMLGPYAIAHLKMAREIHPHGIPMDPDTVLLTDTLELPGTATQSAAFEDPVAAEGVRAGVVKTETPITVCIGNPPYARVAREEGGGWITDDSEGRCPFDDIHDPAKEHAIFSHHASLFNLYVYFWRWAIWKVFEQRDTPGITTFITASSWLTGPGFLGLRRLCREVAGEILVTNLGGDGLGTNPEDNVFEITTPVAIVTLIRAGSPQPHQPGKAAYRRIRGTRVEKLSALIYSRESFTQGYTMLEREDWYSNLVSQTGGTSWVAYPALSDLLPWQQPGCKYGRTWPIYPETSVLIDRWKELLDATDLEDRAAYFVTAKTGRNISTSVAGLTRLRDLPAGTAHLPIVRYGYRSFDRQWALSDPRLAALERPVLWASLTHRQLFLTTMMRNQLGAGPAATATSLVPDLCHFRGSFGGKDVIPLYRDADLTPNADPRCLDQITTAHRDTDPAAPAVTVEALFAYVYAVLAGADFTDRFAEALETPGPRIPLTGEPSLFAETVAFGEHLLWLQTYGERFLADDRPEGITVNTGIDWTPHPSRIPADSRDFTYDPDTATLHVADGAVTGVEPAVWDFQVSGMPIVKKWLGYRTAKGAGKAMSSSSPLDHIRPTEWAPEWSTELLELLTVLHETLALLPIGIGLLDRICDGPLIPASDLPPVPDALRKPPKVTRDAGQLTLGD